MKHFRLQEFFTLSRQQPDINISVDLADKICRYHAIPLDIVRNYHHNPVHVTSGYRPTWWELMRERSGNSHHTFYHKGAVDVVTQDWESFVDQLIKRTDYTRIAYYPSMNFMHLDYGSTERQFIIGEGWKIVTKNELLKKVT